MPRGERFFYRHKVAVIDGTPCESEKNDVCVKGKCMVSCGSEHFFFLQSKSRTIVILRNDFDNNLNIFDGFFFLR